MSAYERMEFFLIFTSYTSELFECLPESLCFENNRTGARLLHENCSALVAKNKHVNIHIKYLLLLTFKLLIYPWEIKQNSSHKGDNPLLVRNSHFL